MDNPTDKDSWKAEAEAVIRDVRDLVKSMNVSTHFESSNVRIYFELLTQEDEFFLVEMTALGFKVVGKKADSIDSAIESSLYETPYSLLTNISSGYSKRFGDQLSSKLEQLKRDKE